MRTWAAKLWGWSWFGVGRVTLQFDETSQNTYTLWMVFLTKKLALAVHVGGGRKRSDPCDEATGGE